MHLEESMTGHEPDWNMGTEIFAAWMLVVCVGFIFFMLYYLTQVRVPAKPILEEVWAVFKLPASWEKKISSATKDVQERIYQIPQLAKFLPSPLPRIQEAKVSVGGKAGPGEIVNSAAVIGAPLSEEEGEDSR